VTTWIVIGILALLIFVVAGVLGLAIGMVAAERWEP
jgi:hypothetical protein